MAELSDRLAREDMCYLTTTGRVTGRMHTIEIWFAYHPTSIYMLAGSGYDADWVKNLQRRPAVTIRIGQTHFAGQARVVSGADEDALARRIVVDKYQPDSDEDLTEWGRTALPVAVDLIAVVPDSAGDIR